MIKNKMQFFTVDFYCLAGVLFMVVYLGVTRNFMDAFYLFVIICYYFRIKFYEWKKYH